MGTSFEHNTDRTERTSPASSRKRSNFGDATPATGDALAWPPSSDLNPLALTGPPSRKRRSGLPLGHMKGPWDDTAAANALLTLQETLPVSEQVKELRTTLEARDAQLKDMISIMERINGAVTVKLNEQQQALLAAGTALVTSHQQAAVLRTQLTTAETEIRSLRATMEQLAKEADKQLVMQHRALEASQAEARAAKAEMAKILRMVVLSQQQSVSSTQQHVHREQLMKDAPVAVSPINSPAHGVLSDHLQVLMMQLPLLRSGSPSTLSKNPVSSVVKCPL